MRIDLPGGDWIDIVDRINYAQMRRIRNAKGGDTALEGLAALTSGWALRDAQGIVVPFPGADAAGVPSAAFDAVPFDLVLAAMEAAVAAPALQGLFEVEAPNVGGSTSTESSMDSTQGSMPSLPTPSSSWTIRGGRTRTSSERPTIS